MTLVTVVLPTYNAAAFISDAIESVLSQTYEEIEIIVVDDGSTDETEKTLSNYQGIKYIRQQNLGAASARNTGILKANGKYIAFIDADDMWLPEKTKIQIDYLLQTGFKWCYCDSYFSWFGKEKVIGKLSNTQCNFQGDILMPYISNIFEIPLPSTIIEREVLESAGLFDEFLRTEEHTDLWSRIAINHPIGYVDQPLVQIRKRFDSLSQITSPEITGRNRRYVLNKLRKITPEKLSLKYNGLVAISYRYEGTHFLRQGQVSKARIRFRKAIQNQPFKLKFYLFWLACFFKPIPKIFYKVRWFLLRDRKPNLNSGWWVKQNT